MDTNLVVHPAWCSSLTAGLPADISKLVNLQVLDLSRHQGSEYAALAVDQSSLNLAAIWQQTQLTRLDMPVSETIRWLPRQIGLLQHLHTLRLDGCTALSKLEAGGISSSETCSLSVGFEGLTRLQVLSLAGCSSLQELPAAVWKLPELLELDLSNCSSLTALVPAAGIGSSSGSGDGGGSSISISISISSSSSLTELKLQQCTNLASLPAHLTKLSRLQALELKGCDALTKLPNLKGMSALTSLVMQGCVLEELPHSLSTLSQLNVLDLLECSKLKSLPNTIWNLPALQVLHVKHCSTLTTLPDAEVRALLPPVEELVLTGCSLALLPELVGRLSSLTRLDLSQCSKLEALPNRMNGMFNLHTLNLASCSKLAKLPDKLPASLRMLDLSYCCQQASLGQSLLNVAHQIGEAEVPLARWENLIAVHLDHNEATDRNLNLNLNLNLSDPGSASACLRALRRATVIEALLADESFVRDLLTKLSWLAILLASAAFAAGRAPPGGWNQGGLPSCNSTMGHSTCPAGSQGYLRQFFVLDLLTFGFSAALVLLLVASAIPCRNVGDRAAVAGQMFLVLCLAVLLLSAALGCGMWTLWVGVLAVYPSEYAGQDVWGPLKVSLALMGLAWIVLIIRPLLLFPGWQAVYKAVTMDPVMGVPINIVQCVAAGL